MAYKDVHELMPGSEEEGKQSRVKRMKKDKMGLKLAGKSSSSVKAEVEEMWDTVGAGDDNLIVDTVVHPQAAKNEENEIDALFNMGKKKKKNERSPAEISMEVENIMAELEVAAEDDAEINRQGEPAVNKLKKMSRLTEVLSKKQLQQEFLDHGVLTLLKTWLQPLPDGSLPNINVRAGILNILMDYPLDLEQYERKDQLKQSGLGKVIMFFSKSDEEASCRKLATDLVNKWSRPLFNKSTRFEDMRKVEEEEDKRIVPFRRPLVMSSSECKDGDLDLNDEFSRKRKASSSRQVTIRPEATQMDFVVRPESKIDAYEIRAQAKQAMPDQRRIRMNKKLQQLKAQNKKQAQLFKPQQS